ncbi:MAG: DUF4124 domain-containing protein [Nitrospirae bacterium]|nr:DUF4124 domain-containing protein [Nitrospirota bacterium]
MKKNYILAVTLTALLPLILLQNASSDIYKYTDKNGTVTYTDTPNSVPDNQKIEVVEKEKLPESTVQKTPENVPLEKKTGDLIAGAIDTLKDTQKIKETVLSFTNSKLFKLAVIIIVFLFIAVVLFMTGRFIWRRQKRKIQLFFKKNNLAEGEKHSGQPCRGFDSCKYTGSIQKHTMQNHFLGEQVSEYRFCSHQKRQDPSSFIPNNISIEEHEKILTKNSLCFHPSEFIPIEMWKCYKCNAIVSAERERHC